MYYSGYYGYNINVKKLVFVVDLKEVLVIVVLGCINWMFNFKMWFVDLLYKMVEFMVKLIDVVVICDLEM